MKVSTYKQALFRVVVILIALVLGKAQLQAQVMVEIKPRTSSKATPPYKDVKNYYLQGDYTMIGNTNMTVEVYDDNKGNGDMIFVDIDNDEATRNSSSAELVIPGGACTEIIYAGLYWSGRAHKSGASPIEFDGFDKRKVKFKKDNLPYNEITANNVDGNPEIFFPETQIANAMYVAYVDVTDYVRQHGAGNYFVADIAVNEGNGGTTGYYGGWGMVVVYKNPSMKWRDITIFDGLGYMKQSVGSAEIPVSGFRALQNGDVNIRMGMMAGEGDVNVIGDFFEIRDAADENWVRLKHEGNTTDNFFNSSILTGGNARNPNLRNNTGIDISMFELDNPNNSIIANNQKEIRLRYGSSKDAYIIFNIVFAVDAYVPEVVGEHYPIASDEKLPEDGGSVNPGQELKFRLDLYNQGEEEVLNTQVVIPVPYNLHYAGAQVIPNLDILGKVSWIPPEGAPNNPEITPGGTIVWDIGTLPYDTSKSRLLGALEYGFKVSDNCILLTTSNGSCSTEIKTNGKITGNGAISGTDVSSDLIKDYGDDSCAGPVYNDFMSTIVISDEFTKNCESDIEEGIMQFHEFCSIENHEFKREDIASYYPEKTKFFTQEPESYESDKGLVTGNFPVSDVVGEKLMYYAVVPGMQKGCFLRLQTSLDQVTTKPQGVEDVELCVNKEVVLVGELSEDGKEKGYELYYYDEEKQLLTEPPAPEEPGIYTYYVAEGTTLNGTICVGPKVKFLITIHAPSIELNKEVVRFCEYSAGVIFVQNFYDSIIYEYSSPKTDGRWEKLDNSIFPDIISIEASGYAFTIHVPTLEINGIKIRTRVRDEYGCEVFAKEYEIQVYDCMDYVNPVLSNKKL